MKMRNLLKEGTLSNECLKDFQNGLNLLKRSYASVEKEVSDTRSPLFDAKKNFRTIIDKLDYLMDELQK